MRSLLFLLCLLAVNCAAAPLTPAARAEIDALMTRLETSGCRVSRNGTWYPAADARSHLTTKLNYLEQRGEVESAEQWIERAASGSSMSGQPYRIQCGDAPPVESATWFARELQAIRATARTGKPP